MIYPGHDFEEQLYMSRLTTWLLYFDDMAHRMPSSLEAFQRNLITNEDDLEVMVTFRRLLADAYRLRDPISANLIVTSCMEFVTGCAIEGSKELSLMKVRETAASWPYFLRTRTGVAHAFSFMIFPRNLNFELSSYIQIMGDANLFIELANDVLSFHKENLVGETNNYVSNRAYTTGKSAIQAHKEIAEDVISAYHRICATLDKSQLEVWKKYANGHLAFHVAQKRYHLDEILSS
ncbi:terpenoid synthase [Moniliophthora roreri MCA 2997]|nr:terpenoid synthase [Moniliophthora roreri MCA 2997]